MKNKFFLILACLLGGLAVVIGAFGAHGLQQILSVKELAIYQTGVTYHFYHVFALLGFLIWNENKKTSLIPAYFFAIGIIIFSGSLYLLAVFHLPKLGMITPIGGLFFILGWIKFSLQVYNLK